MAPGPIAIVLVFTLMWFVLYWLVAGVLFAVVGLAHVVRINTARFSCLFTCLSLAVAYGAAYTGYVAATRLNGKCVSQIDASYRIIPGLFKCAHTVIFSNGVLWFLVLLAAGIGLMFVSRIPDRPRASPRA